MTTQQSRHGVFPVVPTIFDEAGRLDLDGQRRAVDFMIDAGSRGLQILANFSEQFALSDDVGVEHIEFVTLSEINPSIDRICTTTVTIPWRNYSPVRPIVRCV